ncbi:trehalose-phosphatase [Glutamicibacter sp. MNS18]|uniref:trehalose-phosphatase n=1 Tax=Glutamicibacter sp. MNS18 TaxID=2989817 RepID=UPI0022365259|nr:trehalose-phosphatase [Glutamicibacter sp. MNS18]MCW4466511.1 trehalose-phosphatase [Glutamicibacter sp. MNS18]
MDSLPSTLAPELRQALTRLAGSSPLVIALDFDGTMAPLVDRPEDARPLPDSAKLAIELSQQSGVVTALISGRDLQSLRAVHPLPRPEVLIGSHGAEREVPASLRSAAQQIELTGDQSDLLREATKIMEQVSADFTGTSVEYKPASTVLHVRQADEATGLQALEAAQKHLGELSGLRLLAGKAVLEASVLHATKGQALQWLREVTGASSLLFVGDDVTDEDGFRVLDSADLGIKVGAGDTAAAHRIASPSELPAVLRFLLAKRGKPVNPDE